jgi:hypothetical protein
LRAGALAGIAVYIAPFGTRAFASLFEDKLLTRPAWNDGVLKYRVDGTSKVTGEKVFARDIRARDMPHWPQQQAHALALRVTKAPELLRQRHAAPRRRDAGLSRSSGRSADL